MSGMGIGRQRRQPLGHPHSLPGVGDHRLYVLPTVSQDRIDPLTLKEMLEGIR